MKKIFFVVLCLSLLMPHVISDMYGQNDRVIRVRDVPTGWDNRSFALVWYKGNDIMNISSTKFCSPGIVRDVRISPASTSFAAMYLLGKKHEVSIYSYQEGAVKHTFRMEVEPIGIAFTANAKQLFIADRSRKIQIYSTSDWRLVKTIESAIMPLNMALSANNYFVAVAEGRVLYVYNIETGRARKGLHFTHNVNYIAFSPDNAKMAVLTEDGKLQMYDTRTFELSDTYEGLDKALACSFNPEGKYIAVITSPKHLVILNMKNPAEDRTQIDLAEGGLTHIGYAHPVRGCMNMVFNDGGHFVFHPLDGLVPDYHQMMRSQVDEKMNEWMKQQPGESLEEYRIRVNDEIRMIQYTHFENVVATLMVGGLIDLSDVTLGNYNPEQKMLELGFEDIPGIYLMVPQSEIADFSDPKNLVFNNSVYRIREDDTFELIYTEITNTLTGKTYIYDIKAEKTLTPIEEDDNFVPLELIQQSSMEEVKLQEIREEVIEEAKQKSLISEHTHIDVNTRVEASTDADGRKIMNYVVEFQYDVEPEYSSKEDFGLGKYATEGSESALAMLRIVENAFANDLSQYIRPGKKVQIHVTGSADAAPIKRKIPYANEYGPFTDALVYANGELTTLTVTRETGITTNEQLAFLRAMGVKDYNERHMESLSTMQTDYEAYVNVSSERGAEFRRIGIKFIFIDAFSDR